MNILFVSALLPYPLYSGGQVRIYNLLKELSKNHKITLFAFTRTDEEKKYLNELFFLHRIELVHRGRAFQPSYILNAVFGRYPLLLTTYDKKEMRQKIADTLASEKYDLIHIEPFYVWPSIPKTSLPIMVGEHNLEYTIYEQFAKRFFFVPLRIPLAFDVFKLRYWEEKVWMVARHITSVSESDAEVIRQKVGFNKVTVVPNGVDLASFPFRPNDKLHNPPIFLFVGNFTWLQNRDALKFLCNQIWPKIKSIYLNARLHIVGRGMLSSLHRQLRDTSFVFREEVEDIFSEFTNSDILLAPIRIGGGTKFKILEAMAAGVPVITTSLGAEGLHMISGEELYIADTPETIFEAVNLVLSDPKRRQILLKNARRRIEENYSWSHISKRLDGVWKNVYETRS